MGSDQGYSVIQFASHVRRVEGWCVYQPARFCAEFSHNPSLLLAQNVELLRTFCRDAIGLPTHVLWGTDSALSIMMI